MMTSRRLARPFALGASIAAAALVVSACGGSPPPPPATPVTRPVATPAPPAPSPRASTPTSSQVFVSEDIRRACGMSDADAYFAFDSSHVTQTDRSPLDAVAQCFTRGPLSGRSLKLVGRADPRGPTEYNMTLGQSRADSVALYLEGRGLSPSKTSSTSRGSEDATGTTETGWAHDRRVDVLLAN